MPLGLNERNDAYVDYRETFLRLAEVRDAAGGAVSYYNTNEPYTNKSHQDLHNRLRHLIDRSTSENLPSSQRLGISENLADLIRSDERAHQGPLRFHAAFERLGDIFFEKFELSAPGSLLFLEADTHFHLVPLWQAMQAARPYCVVLVVHGKARCFAISGTHVEELDNIFSPADLSPHATVGWSHHIEGNQRERTKHFLKEFVSDLARLMRERRFHRLVTGTRDDLLKELSIHLAEAGLANAIVGRFSLSSFEMALDQVLAQAAPIMATWQETLERNLLKSIRESTLGAVFGVDDVLDALLEGRVRTMLLPASLHRNISECSSCGTCRSEDQLSCPTCQNSACYVMAAEELLLRKALSSNAEIIMTGPRINGELKDVAGLLRY